MRFGAREELQSLKQRRWITLRRTLELHLCPWRSTPQGITTVPEDPIASHVTPLFARSYSHGGSASLPLSLQNYLILPVVPLSFTASPRALRSPFPTRSTAVMPTATTGCSSAAAQLLLYAISSQAFVLGNTFFSDNCFSAC